MKPQTKGLSFLYELVANRPAAVLAAGIIVAVLSSIYAYFHLTFLPNFAGLNSDQISYSRNYEAYVKEFKVEPDIIVMAKGPIPAQNIAFLQALAERLKDDPSLGRIFFRVDLKAFKAWALAYADLPTLKRIRDSVILAKPLFKSIGYRADLTRFWSAIPEMSGHSSSLKTNSGQILELKGFVDLMNQTLGGKEDLTLSFASQFKNLQILENVQYITLKGGTYALLFARPSAERMGDITAITASVRNLVALVAPRFPSVGVHLTGEPVLGADEMQTAKHDIFWAGLLSVLLCSAILIFGFGDIRKTFLTVITLLIGIGWSIGYIALSVGHLNVITLSLFPMLIGLAIDFSIQFLGRYLEERSRGQAPRQAAQTTYFATGTGLLAAATITALGFLAISFTQYKGIAELGVATGGSLLLCFISTMTILPALLLWTDKEEIDLRGERALQLFTSEGAAVERYLLARSKFILALALFLTIILAFKAKQISFDHNVLNLQSKSMDSIKTELELIQVSGKSSLFAVMVTNNLDEAQEYLNRLQHLDTVGSVQSPIPFLPPDQPKKFPLLRQIQSELADFRIDPPLTDVNVPRLSEAFKRIQGMIADGQKKITLASGALSLLQSFAFPGSQVIPHRSLATDLADMHGALDALAKSVAAFRTSLLRTDPAQATKLLTDFQSTLYKNLQTGFQIMKGGIPTREITLSDLPLPVREQFVGKTGKILIQVYPSQNIWERPALERFIAQLREVNPNVTGSPVLILETTRIMLESYKTAAKIALVVILVVAFVQFRKIRLTLFTLTPLAVGLVWLMGIMVIFHKAFNPANLLTLPIILGIGVAFGVYVINRYREERHPAIFSTSTGRSVLLSALTSIAGFASLLGVSHQGLQSLGFTMTVGLSAITFQALVVLPSLLEFVGSTPGVRRMKLKESVIRF